MSSWKVVYAEIKKFEDGREVLKAMRKGIRQPVPRIRKAIRAKAIAFLPTEGGLGKWVAQSRVNAAIKVNSRKVEMRLKGGRNSVGGRSDITAIDRGRVRAPSWGHRGKGSWHTQTVPSGFFTDTADEHADDVGTAINDAVDSAFDQIRRG